MSGAPTSKPWTTPFGLLPDGDAHGQGPARLRPWAAAPAPGYAATLTAVGAEAGSAEINWLSRCKRAVWHRGTRRGGEAIGPTRAGSKAPESVACEYESRTMAPGISQCLL